MVLERTWKIDHCQVPENSGRRHAHSDLLDERPQQRFVTDMLGRDQGVKNVAQLADCATLTKRVGHAVFLAYSVKSLLVPFCHDVHKRRVFAARVILGKSLDSQCLRFELALVAEKGSKGAQGGACVLAILVLLFIRPLLVVFEDPAVVAGE